MKLLLISFVIYYIFGPGKVVCQDANIGGQSKNVILGGESVLDMGRTNKNPLLRLLGTAMTKDKKYILDRLTKSESSVLDRLTKSESSVLDRVTKSESSVLDRVTKSESNVLDRMTKSESSVLDRVNKSESSVLDKLCSLSRCEEWSAWSTCTVTLKGQFEMVKRTRQCGRGPAFCPQDASKVITTEHDSRVCMGDSCPAGFTKTDNGFCFYLHDNTGSRDDAENVCNYRDSFVVNINTQLKTTDLHTFLSQNGITDQDIWMNGRRTSVSSPWTYSYGSGPGDYDNWSSSEPSNGTMELCMIEESTPRLWYDRGCNNSYRIVCEYV